MKNTLLLFIIISWTLALQAQDKPAYVLYNTKGKKVKYKKMIKQLDQADIILFGEYHNDPIAHWLQLEVTQSLAPNNDLILGAEMFETDNQQVLNDYLTGRIDQAALDTLARLWDNYPTDYAPLVNFAKANQLPFIATNIPRRYASRLFRQGISSLENLDDEEKAWMTPIPFTFDITLPGYQAMLDMGGGNEDFPKAQAIKDATMAHFILKNYQKEATFLHFNGTYHSDNYEGILWYLKQAAPNLSYATISMVLQKDIKKLDKEHLGKADFIICVPENMTRTY